MRDFGFYMAKASTDKICLASEEIKKSWGYVFQSLQLGKLKCHGPTFTLHDPTRGLVIIQTGPLVD